MPFIKNSVGAKGQNDVEDVKIIQWWLIRLYKDYENKKCTAFWRGSLPKHNIAENGVIDKNTYLAIKEFINFCQTSISLVTFGTVNFMNEGTIYPNDFYNTTLVTFAANPNFAISVVLNDPRIKQALDGRIDFEQFKHIVETTQGKSLKKLGREMQEYLENPKVKAFLDVIAYAEGTDILADGQQTGYDQMYGGTANNPKFMPNLYNHPTSRSAAGRYQAVGDTWDEAVNLLGLYDMTPESQDIFAVYAINNKRPNIIIYLKADNFTEAINEGSLEWASFPNRIESKGDMETNPTSFYEYKSGKRKGEKQPALALSILRTVYDNAIKKYNGGK